MPDARFYEALPAASAGDLAALSGAKVADVSAAQRRLSGVAPLRGATAHDVTFCSDRRFLNDLGDTLAGAVFVTDSMLHSVPGACVALVTMFPQAGFAMAAGRLLRPRVSSHGASLVDPSALIEAEVMVAPGVTIGAGARIGRGTVIGAGAHIGPGVTIGRDCHIGAGAVIGFALVGDRVRVYGGAVIGEPGFGAAVGPTGVVDVPQLGRVILQDGVTIGANTCVDRGAFDDTIIGENTKIDNLVQIAHNVVIGRNCLVAAQTGISGSTIVGDGCQMGGQVGIADHLTIGAGARLAAAAGVMKNVPAGETWGGTPARPLARWMREAATVGRLAHRPSKGVEKI